MTPFDEYFYPIFGGGMLVAGIAALTAGILRGFLFPACLLAVAVLAVWGSLFIGSELGYRAWQAMDNPPEEAFADTFPMGALMAGWVPGLVFSGTVFCIARVLRMLLVRRPNETSDSRSDTPPRVSDNPYQSP